MTGALWEVSALRRADTSLAACLLAVALQEDPGWAHVVPDPDRRRVAMTTVTRVAVRDALPFSAVLAAREGDRLAGVAVWLPPGRYPMGARRKLRTSPATAVFAVRTPGDIGVVHRRHPPLGLLARHHCRRPRTAGTRDPHGLRRQPQLGSGAARPNGPDGSGDALYTGRVRRDGRGTPRPRSHREQPDHLGTHHVGLD